MTLKEKQLRFSEMINDLESWMRNNNYRWMNGHGKRCSEKTDGFECPIGAKDSNHKILLAKDYALFLPVYIKSYMSDGSYTRKIIDWEYTKKTEDYKELGEEWLSLGKMYEVDAVWGGDYDDGNHFSIRHRGRW